MRSLRLVVKAAAVGADHVRRPVTGLVVLIYHRVGRRSAVDVDLPLELFEHQVQFLTEQCRVVSLDEGLRLVASARPPPASGSVVVTFDDGTADFADIVLPVLVRYSIPVTLYAATAFIDSGTEFPDAGTPLSWSALRDAHSTGLVDVGSHTHRHTLLDRIDERAVADELDRSIDAIGTNLGVAPRHFAYPKGAQGSAGAEHEVRARFRSAALAGTRANPFGSTIPYRLARSPIQASDGMRWFRHKVRGGMALEDGLRRVLNARRHRHSVS